MRNYLEESRARYLPDEACKAEAWAYKTEEAWAYKTGEAWGYKGAACTVVESSSRKECSASASASCLNQHQRREKGVKGHTGL